MRFMISHAVEDSSAALTLKALIERCSLGAVNVWFSSDRSEGGGMTFGAAWFNDLHERMRQIDGVICLMTPSSIGNAWLHYEAGFVAAKINSTVVPACLGVRIDDLPMPHAAYQSYDIADPIGLSEFLGRVLTAAAVRYDEELTQDARAKSLQSMLTDSREARADIVRGEDPFRQAIEALGARMDRRFHDLFGAIPKATGAKLEFDISFRVRTGNTDLETFSLRLSTDDTIGFVLDSCWRHLRARVPPYTYLERWMIVNERSERRLIIRDIQAMVPANVFFWPDEGYTIQLLDAPYDPRIDSGKP